MKNITILFILIFFSSCSGSLPTNYYILSAMEVDSSTPLKTTSYQRVLLRPITLVDYLRKDRVITRTGLHQINVSDFHLWAEPLEKNIVRVLIENLNNNNKGIVVESFSHQKKKNIDKSIKINIEQFERVDDEIVELKSEVSFFDSEQEKFNKVYDLQTQCSSSSIVVEKHSVTVECMSKALAEFSKVLLEDISPTVEVQSLKEL